ncbi:MAG: sigma-70 family RNA polymerase sigma factor [Oscillospiraceae bacterium]|nr:sigma-70 family RNA polymerase sigma factor [Oscillospiraceae bacterium]
MSLQLKTEREQFIENNMGLVHSCAKRFKGKGIEYEEMFAAGCVGLVKAYDAFDHSRGVQFSTYAVPVILGEIKKLFRDGGMLKVTRSIKELSLKVSYAKEHLQKQTGQEPGIKEIADFLGVAGEDVAQAISASTPPMSLTAMFEEEDGRCEFDIPVESGEESLANMMGLKYAISDLEAEEKRIIYLRFFQGKTQSVTAEMLGKTQVQISRQERKIIQKMRKKFME